MTSVFSRNWISRILSLSAKSSSKSLRTISVRLQDFGLFPESFTKQALDIFFCGSHLAHALVHGLELGAQPIELGGIRTCAAASCFSVSCFSSALIFALKLSSNARIADSLACRISCSLTDLFLEGNRGAVLGDFRLMQLLVQSSDLGREQFYFTIAAFQRLVFFAYAPAQTLEIFRETIFQIFVSDFVFPAALLFLAQFLLERHLGPLLRRRHFIQARMRGADFDFERAHFVVPRLEQQVLFGDLILQGMDRSGVFLLGFLDQSLDGAAIVIGVAEFFMETTLQFFLSRSQFA